jgi:23S rRNA (uracil1939-C5)-methyltransferase
MSKKRRRKPLPEGFYDAQIDSLSSDARGVAHIEGKAVFIDGALPGESVSFRYTRCHKRYDEGIVESVIQPSSDRVEPRCEHALLCGGCSLQHLSSDAQISYKQQMLLDNLSQIGKVTADNLLPPLTADVWGYRRKARLGVRDVKAKGRVLVGFREKRHRYLADLQQCEVLVPAVGHQLKTLSDLVASLDARQSIAQIEVAASDDATSLVFRHLEPLGHADLERLAQFASNQDFIVYLQSGGPDSIEPLWPQDPVLSYRLPEYDLTFTFGPSDFTQVNAGINQKMVSQAIRLLDVQPGDHVLDLFCGLGNFALAIARQANKVTAIEGDEVLVEKARKNAQGNAIANVAFHANNLFEDLELQAWTRQQYDRLLLDPPRSGAQAIAENMHRLQPARIVYVSCHPATLARDAQILVHEKGYRLTHAGVMDMFPHTMHVESIAVFDRINMD